MFGAWIYLVFFAAVCVGTFLLVVYGGPESADASEDRIVKDHSRKNRFAKLAGAALIIIPILLLLSFLLGTAV
jgi:hypothetical protein